MSLLDVSLFIIASVYSYYCIVCSVKYFQRRSVAQTAYTQCCSYCSNKDVCLFFAKLFRKITTQGRQKFERKHKTPG